MKYCPRCKTEKDESSFHKNKKRSDGLASYCAACSIAYKAEWLAKVGELLCSDCSSVLTKAKTLAWCKPCSQNKASRLRLSVLDAYGGRICSCCGETQLAFLSLDHVNDNGAEHRRALGGHVYEWLAKHDFPDKDAYRVLCRNCNWGRRVNNGICPHQENV